MNKLNIIKNAIFVTLSVLSIFALTTVNRPVQASNAAFQTGNIYIASNSTNPAYGDPISANVGDIIEFKVSVTDTGTDTANNVVVRADLPTNVSGGSISSTIHVSADNASEVTDTATVDYQDDGNPHSLVYFPGDAFLVTNNGSTQLPDTITSGVNIGNVLPGASNYVEVTFKATLTETVAPTATPTPTSTPMPTATPTPTSTPGPTATPTPTSTPTPTTTPGVTATPTPTGTVTIQCPTANGGTVDVTVSGNSAANFNCNSVTVNVTNTNNNTNTATGGSVTLASSAVTPTPTPQTQIKAVKELPETGLPIEAWALSGMLPMGFGLRKLVSGKSVNKVAESAHFMWQQREFLKK